jgi:hypothetical protein
MEAEKKEALDRALKLLVDSLEQGKELAQDQLPVIVNEIVAWGRASTTATVLGGVALGVLTWLAWRGAIGRKTIEWWDNEDPNCIFPIVGFCVSPLISVLIVCVNTSTCLMAWFAPRVYVIQELKELLK